MDGMIENRIQVWRFLFVLLATETVVRVCCCIALGVFGGFRYGRCRQSRTGKDV